MFKKTSPFCIATCYVQIDKNSSTYCRNIVLRYSKCSNQDATLGYIFSMIMTLVLYLDVNSEIEAHVWK